MIHHEKELAHLVAMANDLARDDKATTAMLALLRVGHPGSNLHGPTTQPGDDPGEPPYGDPTGEAAIQPDPAVQDGRTYTAAIARAIRALTQADHIRTRCITATTTTIGHARDSDTWCRNCLRAGYCNPREKGRIYCSWCRGRQDAYGILPPAELVTKREHGMRVTDQDMRAAKHRATPK